MSYRLSVDVGGTFTDIVLFDDGTQTIHTTKVHSTPGDSSIGIEKGIRKICRQADIAPEDISYFIHGTTVATNALLERKGAKSALITTQGFRDIMEIAHQTRPDLYNFWVQRPPSPIPRYLVFEVPERVMADGSVSVQLDESSIPKIAAQLRELEVESVAICFINSYKNPAHELRVKELLLKECSRLHLCTSYETLPEIREYERFCTTAVNAYLMPKVKDYISNLDVKRKNMGIVPGIHIMQSNGGVMSSYAAGERSVHTVFSGPAGGVLATMYMSRLIGESNVVTIDIGGTSSDLALIQNHEPGMTSSAELGGFPVKVPTIEMHTIGAGGGSIAWVDKGGGIRVGPQSAGAVPGPACYGNGEEPTVTDANLIMGYLNPANFLGGEYSLDKKKSEDAVSRRVGLATGLPPMQAAAGIRHLANANMCGGINVISTQKGYDLREFALFAFGGGGSLHAVDLADELNIKKVVVPLTPGNFSAVGCQLAKVRYDYVRTAVCATDALTIEEYNDHYAQMKKEALADLKEEGFAEDQLLFNATADMRYTGQAYELSVPVDNVIASADMLAQYAAKFAEIHKRTYGYAMDDKVIFVNLRFSAFAILPSLEFARHASVSDPTPPADAKKQTREMMFGDAMYNADIYDRAKLPAGSHLSGPAVIEEYAASTVVPPKHVAAIDNYLNIVIERE